MAQEEEKGYEDKTQDNKTVRQDCSSRLFVKTVQIKTVRQDCSLRMFVKTVQIKTVRQDCLLRMFVKTVCVVIDDDQKVDLTSI